MSMFITGNRFFINAMVLLSLCFLPSCNQKGQPEKKPVGLFFSESSNGLPDSGFWRHGLSLYDFNGDGLMDIFAPPPRMPPEGDNVPFLWQQKTDGSWVEKRLDVPADISYDYGGISVNDFNADGIPDLALAGHLCPLTLLMGTSEGEYSNAPKSLPSNNALTSRAVDSTDLNNDGRPDIVACSEANFKRAGYTPKGVWACMQSISRWTCNPIGSEDVVRDLFSDQVLIGDVNGDGNKDIAVSSLVSTQSEIIWLGDGKGSFTPFNQGLTRNAIYLNIALADINGDDRDDLVASITGFGKDGFLGLKVFLSGSEGFTEMSGGLPEKEYMVAVAAGDLDGDGNVEIIGATSKGGIMIYSQAGDVWKKQMVSGIPEDSRNIRIYSVYCMDVNNDGKKDIIYNHASVSFETGGIRVFLNQSGK
ncbi:MAG: VCBS repeat-containing protein [Deltaproteobacteria bacterium]|nr:VCBS repeat-containing protein [Deltaproteobacteria bacterium]